MASRVNYTRLVRQTAAQANMPWVYWEFGSAFGVYDPVTNAFRPELLNALVGN
jgi:endoglucanase